MEPAHKLAQKVSEVVKAIHRAVPDLFGNEVGAKLHWKNKEGELLNAVGSIFRSTGELWGIGNALRYGLTAIEGTAYWTVAVQPDNKFKREAARRRAGEAGFGIEWERPATGPSILIARTRATALGSHEAAVEWFKNRMRELAESRVLEELLGLGAQPIRPPVLPGAGQPSGPTG